jgi:signal transduction histidine kinase
MSRTQDLIQPRIATYLKSTWYTRWIIIAIVASSFWFMPHVQRDVIGALLILAPAYNLLLFAGNRWSINVITNRPIILLVDGIMSLLLVIYTGALSSPYLFILAFMVISGAFWYGVQVALLIGTLQITALIVLHLIQHASPAVPKTLVVQMLIVMTIGIYVSWLTESERSERHILVARGTETEKERQQLLALINSVRDAVLVLDNSNRIVIYNQAADALIGNQADLHGQPFDKLVQFIDAGGLPTELKIKHGGELERKDLRLRAADNSIVSMAISLAPYIVDRQNNGHVVILHDTSEDKTIGQEREEFIAVASHELRTPLTIALGDVSMLLAPPYLPENRETINILNSALRSLQQLSHIIDDLTNLSQVENEKLDVVHGPLDSIALLHEFQADYADQAKAKGLKLRVTVEPGLDTPTTLTSRYVVREILAIFVNNAIKFTDSGSVTLSLITPRESGGVTFSVSDTGIGVSQSDQKKIFEKFFQSEHYTTRMHGGTGLGLYIAKRLAARITAKISFDTELGKGSTFYLWIPPYSHDKNDQAKVATAETKNFFDTV